MSAEARRRALRAVLHLAVAAATLAGCAHGPPAGAERQAPLPPVRLDASDDRGYARLVLGQELTVTLPVPPAASLLTWRVGELDRAVVEVRGQPMRAPSLGEVGSGQTEMFRFRAVGPGQADVELYLTRAGELPLSQSQVFVVHVTVE